MRRTLHAMMLLRMVNTYRVSKMIELLPLLILDANPKRSYQRGRWYLEISRFSNPRSWNYQEPANLVQISPAHWLSRGRGRFKTHGTICEYGRALLVGI